MPTTRTQLTPTQVDAVVGALREAHTSKLAGPAELHALTPFYRVYIPVFIAYAKSCGAGDEALDVVQAVVEKVLRKVRRGEFDPSRGGEHPEYAFFAYHKAAIARDCARWSARRETPVGDAGHDGGVLNPPDRAPSVEEIALSGRQMAQLLAHVTETSPNRALAFVFCKLFGWSAAEAAEGLGTDAANVRQLVCRARAELRARYRDHGLDLDCATPREPDRQARILDFI